MIKNCRSLLDTETTCSVLRNSERNAILESRLETRFLRHDRLYVCGGVRFCGPTQPTRLPVVEPRNDGARASDLRVAFRADRGDAKHVGGAGSAQRHAGDDNHALAGAGKTVAKRDRAGTAHHVVE